MKRKLLFLFLAALTLTAPLLSCAPQKQETDGKLLLAQNGTTEYVITLSKTATVVEKKAADELQSYLQKICGVSFSIQTDAREQSGKELCIGMTSRDAGEPIDRASLGEDGFLIRNFSDSIFLCGGNERGTLYAVYTFLEEYLGVRFFAEEMEKIPFLPTLAIEPFSDNVQKPQFEFRQECHQSPDSDTWNEKQKLNAENSDDITPIAGGISYTGPWFVHTLGTLAGMQKPFYKHQPCLTDENVFLKVLGNAKSYIEQSPDAEIISVSQNDSTLKESGECQCEECLKENEKYGAPSGTMLAFVNHVANALHIDYPDIKVETLAYYYTQTPPTGIRASSNVIVRFCNAGACINHAMEDESAQSDNMYAKNTALAYDNLKGWCDIAEHVYVWDYDTDFGCALAAIPNFDRLYKNLHTYAELGVKGVFIQGMRSVGEFDDLRAYLVAKLLWNPSMSEEEFYGHMTEFMEYYYGAGASDIKEYIELLETFVGDAHISMYHDITNFWTFNTTKDASGKTVLDTTELDQMYALFAAAESKATSYTQLTHIRRTKLTLLYQEIVARFATREATGESLETLQKLNEKLCDQMRTYNLKSLKETLAIPKLPNFKNAPLYWGWDGEGVFQPSTEPEPAPEPVEGEDPAADPTDGETETPPDVTLAEG